MKWAVQVAAWSLLVFGVVVGVALATFWLLGPIWGPITGTWLVLTAAYGYALRP